MRAQKLLMFLVWRSVLPEDRGETAAAWMITLCFHWLSSGERKPDMRTFSSLESTVTTVTKQL